ncbi:MAG TPA: hypothetical protein VK724_20995 [Bryobacteraceae bacterium]|nr:hypothetical protein [Bryobacteraceae bacterium]
MHRAVLIGMVLATLTGPTVDPAYEALVKRVDDVTLEHGIRLYAKANFDNSESGQLIG